MTLGWLVLCSPMVFSKEDPDVLLLEQVEPGESYDMENGEEFDDDNQQLQQGNGMNKLALAGLAGAGMLALAAYGKWGKKGNDPQLEPKPEEDSLKSKVHRFIQTKQGQMTAAAVGLVVVGGASLAGYYHMTRSPVAVQAAPTFWQKIRTTLGTHKKKAALGATAVGATGAYAVYKTKFAKP